MSRKTNLDKGKYLIMDCVLLEERIIEKSKKRTRLFYLMQR